MQPLQKGAYTRQGARAQSQAATEALPSSSPSKPTFNTVGGPSPLSLPVPVQKYGMHYATGTIKEEHKNHIIRRKMARSPTGRTGSPERGTFDIDDGRMHQLVERGVDRKEGIPVTKFDLGFGQSNRQLLDAASTSAKNLKQQQ